MNNIYIDLLSDEIRQAIYMELLQLDLSKEDIERAMSSRLCDLSDTLDVSKYYLKDED